MLELLVQKAEKLKYYQEPLRVLWEAYGFREADRLKYHGDVLLYEALFPPMMQKERRKRRGSFGLST